MVRARSMAVMTWEWADVWLIHGGGLVVFLLLAWSWTGVAA